MASMSYGSELASMSPVYSGDDPKGFPPVILGTAMSTKYQCWHCNMVLRNPVQSYCGHRLCKNCMQYLVRTNTTGSPVVCKLCQDENETVDEESFIKEEETFPDNAIRREMLSLPVVCSFPNCTWSGQFREYEAHAETCEFATAVCETCKETVLKSKLSEHEATAHRSGSNLCPVGCMEQVSVEDLSRHIEQNLVGHFTLCVERISAVEHVVWGTQRPAEGRSIADRISEVERAVNQQRNVAGSGSVAASGGAVGGASASGSAAQSMLNATDKLVIYEGVITVLNREVEKLSVQVEAIERQRVLERELLDNVDRKVRSMERLIAMKDATIAELELRVTSLEQTSYDGTLLWRVGDFARKKQEAISGRVTSIYSPPFYTSKTGYKMCARLYLNGDGMGKGTHVSLFFVVMRGNFDPLLKWPFKQKVTLMFVDQNNREHVVDAFRPDPTSSSFKRPTTEMNIASGCPLLMPLPSLDSTVNAYVKDNTAFIKIIVNCDDLT